MLRQARNIACVCVLAALAAACATAPPGTVQPSPQPGGGVYKVGSPYQIDGTWYYPREQPDYDETGIASWYGPNFYGKATANGELYDGTGLTAAHRTLPLPVNVRVTNLENGKSLVVRVNDRGPYAKGRIIDVSPRVAQLLGFYGRGTARVRVTYVSRADLPGGYHDDTPMAIAKALPAAPAGTVETAALTVPPGTLAAAPIQTKPLPAPAVKDAAPPDTANEPTGQVTTVPVPAMTHLYVQAGAFTNLENANRLKSRFAGAGGLFISPLERKGQRLYRVRSGPYDELEAANAALAKLNELGNNDAEIVVDE